MLFVDYVFEKVFNNIRFDKDLNPSLLDIKSGDKFVAHVDEDNMSYKLITRFYI
jgi:hypothetical protein